MKVNGMNNISIKDFLNFKDTEIVEKNVAKKSDFSDFLLKSLNEVNSLELESDHLKEKLALGELDNFHDLSIAMEKASISLQLTSSIRNKVTEAYREIMRIQI